MDGTKLDTPITRVLGLLEKKGCQPKPAGLGSWKSRCPAHGGSSWNLSIRETSDGTVLLHCHHVGEGLQTCTNDAIMRELGIGLGINRIGARDHNLSGYCVTKGKYPLDHFPFVFGDNAPLFAFVNYLLYFFFDVICVFNAGKPPEAHSEPILDPFG